MINQKRKNQIKKMLEEQQTVTNKELMERFGISIETVRRDLAFLEKQGVLTRVYGGAVKKEVVNTEPLYLSRERENIGEKLSIAEAAEGYIKSDDIVFFDLGTTVEIVARKLEKTKNIYALTNAIRTAITLSEKCAEVIMIGGRIRPGELAVSGGLSELCINKFNIDKAIIGAGGITEDGVSDFILDEANIRSDAIQNANKVIVVADYSKFGIRAKCRVCAVQDIDILITDDKAPKDILQKIEKKGVQIIIK